MKTEKAAAAAATAAAAAAAPSIEDTEKEVSVEELKVTVSELKMRMKKNSSELRRKNISMKELRTAHHSEMVVRKELENDIVDCKAKSNDAHKSHQQRKV